MKQIVLLLTLSFTFSIINAQTTQRKEIKSSAGVSLVLPFLSNAIYYGYADETNDKSNRISWWRNSRYSLKKIKTNM